MSQIELFNDLDGENEDDLLQKVDSFEQAVVWATDWTTETIHSQLVKGTIDLQPKFQRRDAWTVVAKSKFIESLLLGLPIPQIILAEKKDNKGKYLVIDGKQRLLTIRNFFANGDDPFSPLKLKGLTILEALNGKTYSDIQNNPSFNQLIDQLHNQPIRTTVIKNWPNESFLFTVFLRLNTGSIKLSPQELRQALHPGPFIDFADDFSINSVEIKQMLRLSAPDFRMRDVEIVIRYFSNKYFLESYDGNLKNAFDNTVQILNEEWKDREKQILVDANALNSAIAYTIEVFSPRDAFSKWNGTAFQGNFNRAIFDIMTFYFSLPELRSDNPGIKTRIKEEFIMLCANDTAFLSSLEATTKSLSNTQKRYNTWGEKLAEVLGRKVMVPQIDINGRLSFNNSTNG